MTADSGDRAKNARGAKASGSQGSASQGLGAAAGDGRSASHQTDPDTVTDNERGHQADTPTEIPPKGWLAIAKRTAKEVKADQVPLLSAGVAFYALLALFPAIIAGVSIYGLVADPTTVRDQIANLTKLLSPETADLGRPAAHRSHQRSRGRPGVGHRGWDPDRPVERLQRHEGPDHRGQPGL